MHVEVRSHIHKLLASLRQTSVAGRGLPERMRSTAFAFLGLTAAAGLALVAIFAQLGFPLLSPQPMPRDPARLNAVAGAVAVEQAPRAVAAGGRRTPVPPSSLGRAAPPAPVAAKPDAVEAPAPDPSPGPAPDVGHVNADQTAAPNPSPAPAPSAPPSSAPTTPPPPAPPPAPAPEPVPVSSPPPEAAPPAVPVGPGNSSSAAAAAHASQQGIEASGGKAHGHGK